MKLVVQLISHPSNQQAKKIEPKVIVHPPGDVGGSHPAPPTFAKEGKCECVLNCECQMILCLAEICYQLIG